VLEVFYEPKKCHMTCPTTGPPLSWMSDVPASLMNKKNSMYISSYTTYHHILHIYEQKTLWKIRTCHHMYTYISSYTTYIISTTLQGFWVASTTLLGFWGGLDNALLTW
jgi:hypothetical protein